MIPVFMLLSLVRKYWQVALLVALVAIGAVAIRRATNAAYYNGIEQGRRLMGDDIEKLKAKEWAAREAAIETQRKEAQSLIDRTMAERSALGRARLQSDEQFRAQLTTIATRAQEASSHVLEIPDTDLTRVIRDQLARNRAGEQ